MRILGLGPGPLQKDKPVPRQDSVPSTQNASRAIVMNSPEAVPREGLAEIFGVGSTPVRWERPLLFLAAWFLSVVAVQPFRFFSPAEGEAWQWSILSLTLVGDGDLLNQPGPDSGGVCRLDVHPPGVPGCSRTRTGQRTGQRVYQESSSSNCSSVSSSLQKTRSPSPGLISPW